MRLDQRTRRRGTAQLGRRTQNTRPSPASTTATSACWSRQSSTPPDDAKGLEDRKARYQAATSDPEIRRRPDVQTSGRLTGLAGAVLSPGPAQQPSPQGSASSGPTFAAVASAPAAESPRAMGRRARAAAASSAVVNPTVIYRRGISRVHAGGAGRLPLQAFGVAAQ